MHGFSIPPAVHTLLEALYGDDKWYRCWAMVLTFCAVLCLVRVTRRLGAMSFVGIFAAAAVYHFLQDAYYQFTPH
jgi:hypothetical protein